MDDRELAELAALSTILQHLTVFGCNPFGRVRGAEQC